VSKPNNNNNNNNNKDCYCLNGIITFYLHDESCYRSVELCSGRHYYAVFGLYFTAFYVYLYVWYLGCGLSTCC